MRKSFKKHLKKDPYIGGITLEIILIIFEVHILFPLVFIRFLTFIINHLGASVCYISRKFPAYPIIKIHRLFGTQEYILLMTQKSSRQL